MPPFTFDGQQYQNPVELAQDVIGGKWKMPILWRVARRTWRYNELRRELPAISHKMLTQQLRELERHGLITRTVHPVVPPHVDYDITPRAHDAPRHRGAPHLGRRVSPQAQSVICARALPVD